MTLDHRETQRDAPLPQRIDERLGFFRHLHQLRPLPTIIFARQFLRRVETHMRADVRHRRRVIEVNRTGSGSSLSRCGSVLAHKRNITSLVLCTFTSASTTTMYLVNIICPMPHKPCMILNA